MTARTSICGLLALLALAGAASLASAQGNAVLIQRVNQADPGVTWTVPQAIPFGEPLDASAFDAVARTAGVFSYAQTAGSILPAGTYILTASFVPTDPNYHAVSASVPLVVTPPGSSSFSVGVTGGGSTSGLVNLVPGIATTVLLTIAPIGDFHQPVTLTCNDPPVGLVCAFSPATIRVTSAEAQVTLTLLWTSAGMSVPPGSGGLAVAAGTPGMPSAPLFPAPAGPAVALSMCMMIAAGLGRRLRLPASWRRGMLAFGLAAMLPFLGTSLGCGMTRINEIKELSIHASSLVETRNLTLRYYIGAP